MRKLIILSIVVITFSGGYGIPSYYMDEFCNGTIDISWPNIIKLQLTRNLTYNPNMDCHLVVTTTNLVYNQFMLHFKDINIEPGTPCRRDFLEVRDGRMPDSPFVSGYDGPLCGLSITTSVQTTSGGNLYLRFKSDSTRQSTGFTLIIVQYHTGYCYTGQYSCDNNRCIDHTIVCDGYNPCGDFSDCPFILAAGAIAAIVVGTLAFLVMCLIILACLLRRRSRRLYHRHLNVTVSPGYGSQGYGSDKPQQYVPYPIGQQYPTNLQQTL